ncbi:MAG: type I 3-dehydroquinate dehydratase [Pyrinomonadaceae bacterium]
MAKTSLVATINKAPSQSGKELSALTNSVTWLEVRADLVGDLDPDWLRSCVKGSNLIYTLRSRAHGGIFDGSMSERQRRLLVAANHYDLIELEANDDLRQDILARIPPQKRLVSWRGREIEEIEPSRLEDRFRELSAVGARVYKLVTVARKTGDELAPLLSLKSLGRSDTVAFAQGQGTLWSRLLAPYFGSPFVFGTIDEDHTNPDEPTIRRLIGDYGLPSLPPLSEIYGIVGSPISRSLSPRLHNAAYRSAGYPALFLPFHVECFSDFWQRVVLSGALESLGLSIRGLTVVSPHKEVAIREVDISSPMVRRACSTNIFLRNNDHWEADTTDTEVVTLAIEELGIDVKGKKAAVVGCGGAGRVIAAALDQAGAQVTLVNRGQERGVKAVEVLGLPFMLLSEFSVEDFSIIVNATPVGRDDDELPFEVDRLSKDALVIDLVYRQGNTPLITKTLAMGNNVIAGKEVLIIEVRRQFQMMTGLEMPDDLAHRVLGLEAQHSSLVVAG